MFLEKVFFWKGIFYIFGTDILPKALLCKQVGMYELMLILQTIYKLPKWQNNQKKFK